jgi:hypothetical protein
LKGLSDGQAQGPTRRQEGETSAEIGRGEAFRETTDPLCETSRPLREATGAARDTRAQTSGAKGDAADPGAAAQGRRRGA